MCAREWVLGNNSPTGIASATSHLVRTTHIRDGRRNARITSKHTPSHAQTQPHTAIHTHKHTLHTRTGCSIAVARVRMLRARVQIYWTIDLCYAGACILHPIVAQRAVSVLILQMICFVMHTWPTKRFNENTMQCSPRLVLPYARRDASARF